MRDHRLHDARPVHLHLERRRLECQVGRVQGAIPDFAELERHLLARVEHDRGHLLAFHRPDEGHARWSSGTVIEAEQRNGASPGFIHAIRRRTNEPTVLHRAHGRLAAAEHLDLVLIARSHGSLAIGGRQDDRVFGNLPRILAREVERQGVDRGFPGIVGEALVVTGVDGNRHAVFEHAPRITRLRRLAKLERQGIGKTTTITAHIGLAHIGRPADLHVLRCSQGHRFVQRSRQGCQGCRRKELRIGVARQHVDRHHRTLFEWFDTLQAGRHAFPPIGLRTTLRDEVSSGSRTSHGRQLLVRMLDRASGDAW